MSTFTKPNRFAVSTRAEEQATRRNREPAQRLLQLMNLYHSLDSKYFPSPQTREEIKKELRTEIMNMSKYLPDHIQNRLKDALGKKQAWDDVREHIF